MNTSNRDEKKNVQKEIEYLREKLNDMLVSKEFEIDEEILYLSKKIDVLLNIYSKFVNDREDTQI